MPLSDYIENLHEVSMKLNVMRNDQRNKNQSHILTPISICNNLLQIILNNKSFFCQYTSLTSDRVKDKLSSIVLPGIMSYNQQQLEIMANNFSILIKEAYLTTFTIENSASTMQISEAYGMANKHFFVRHGDYQDDYIYFWDMLPAEILKNKTDEYLSVLEKNQNRSINDITDTVSKQVGIIDSKIEEFNVSSENLKENINKALNMEERVNKKMELLKDENRELNFELLANSFDKIYKNKRNEKNSLLVLLLFFGVFILIPIMYTLYLDGLFNVFIVKNSPYIVDLKSSIFNIADPNWKIGNLLKIVPITALEAILIYYFRIILQNFSSVKFQILQLKYKITITNFANDYFEFLQEKYPEEKLKFLEKFEKLIFNEINPDTKNIPTPLGAFEPLFKIFEEAKKS